MKAAVYNSLTVINQATQQITESIEHLKTEGLLVPHFAEIRKLAAEQNCAETCLSAILALANREQQDAAQSEQERIRQEESLRSR